MSASLPSNATQVITTSSNVTTVNLKSRKKQKAVQWDEEVVDNEGMGKKSSKICCIYTPPEAWDDSSDSEDSSEEHNCSDHHHHHRKKPIQHPHDHKPFTGVYTPEP